MAVNKNNLLQQLLDRLDHHPDDRLVASLQDTLLDSVSAEAQKTAHIETAVTLTPAEVTQLTRIIQDKFPQVADFDFQVSPRLLAGIKIRVGDELIDDSAETALDLMKKTLI